MKWWKLPEVLRPYRWRWFIHDLKFRTCMRYLSKRSFFTKKELGTRFNYVDKSLLDLWKMK